ncbi:MAG: hypothetical protein PHS32_23545 [Rhodoferax sp.]|uniref:hypothetical protein n=1 Tax=Rhodoferax sp. TaxID=50421 RepID=UPI00260558A4|nr:hypothetical protein [Rhodoferax sp.]MDD5336724.1 hypothetical protein [Rhodoferax sp.]
MQSRDAIKRWLLASVFAALTQQAGAQTLSEVSVAVQGDDVVAHVSFSGSVRLVQQSPTVPTQFVQLQIELLTADEAVLKQMVAESRHVAAAGATPEFTLVLNAAPNTRMRQMTLQLREVTQVRARQGKSPNVIDIVLVGNAAAHPTLAPPGEKPGTAAAQPGPALPAPAGTPAGVLASAEVEARAAELMASARDAVSKGRTEAAISQLNQLLLLPPNSATQDAQEMMGLAWERSGDLARAKMEYELYLKLFRSGEGAQRVAQRLASMGVAPTKPEAPAQAAQPLAAQQSGVKYTGSVAQYYFGGKSRSQSLVNLDSGIDQSTLTKTTESALVTNLDLGARYTTEASDIRAVFRGTGSANLSETSNNTSILNAAYIDYRQTASGMAARVGRQSAINGGLLGMFDGVSLTYPVRPGLRVNVMGGAPANPLVSAPGERLFAAMVEADSIIGNLSGDMYLLNQSTEGIANRRAIGTELRYSDERGSLYALLDYDQLFHAVNAFSVQGSMQGAGQTTYTLLLDSRKAPSLQVTNALISSGAASLNALLQTQSMEEVLAAARATTAQARQILFSVSKPLGEKWQATGDIRFSDIGELPAVGNFEATPATGAQYGLSLQLTGSNLYSKRDINNFNLSLLSTPFFHGAQLAYNNLTGFADNKITLEPSMRVYVQQDVQGSRMTRVTPGLRASYNWSKRTSVMGECMVEHSTNQGPTNQDTTNSVFFYFGLRHELF